MHILVEVSHQLVALVQQVVGGLAGALGARYFVVDVGDALRQAVDVADLLAELLRDAGLQVVQVLRRRSHALGRFVHARQRHRARREIGGRVGNVRERIEHVVDRRTESGSSTWEEAFKLLQFISPAAVGCTGGARQCRLARQERTEVALNRLDVDPFADVATAGELARCGLQDRTLARVTRRIDVGNVIACRLQHDLVGLQGAGANAEKSAHIFCATTCARCSLCVVSMARLSLAA